MRLQAIKNNPRVNFGATNQEVAAALGKAMHESCQAEYENDAVDFAFRSNDLDAVAKHRGRYNYFQGMVDAYVDAATFDKTTFRDIVTDFQGALTKTRMPGLGNTDFNLPEYARTLSVPQCPERDTRSFEYFWTRLMECIQRKRIAIGEDKLRAFKQMVAIRR